MGRIVNQDNSGTEGSRSVHKVKSKTLSLKYVEKDQLYLTLTMSGIILLCFGVFFLITSLFTNFYYLTLSNNPVLLISFNVIGGTMITVGLIGFKFYKKALQEKT